MRIDRLTTIAFSMYSNKGAYALLLGSGVSRAAHMPSAWDVENRLIQQIATTRNVHEQDDWHEWYKQQFGARPDYSSLLDSVASTKTERVGLMKKFFEPTEEEKELGWKKPTNAHKAIARLVKMGYVRIILTTNFDRLMEEALNAVNQMFQVIQDESDLDKITPIAHSSIPTIVKINGDYIDCRFRNTASELSSYPGRLRSFLSRVFEDYGLITSGWSATWDTGLVEILKGSPATRYNSFFGYVKKSNDTIMELAEKRHGEVIAMESADAFFKEIHEQVESLERNQVNRNISREILEARIKKYLSSNQYDIDYTDLIEHFGNDVYETIQSIANYKYALNRDSFRYFLKTHHEAVSELMDMAIIVGRWGKPHHIKTIGEVLVKLCIRPLENGKITAEGTQYVHGIAATLLLNALGLTCVYYSKYKGLNDVLRLIVPAQNFMSFSSREPLLYLIGDSHLGSYALNTYLEQNYYYPYSILLLNELRDHFKNIFTLDDEYENAFYTWEHFKSLVYGYNKCYLFDKFSVPIGHFIIYETEQRYYRKGKTPYCYFFDSAHELESEWPPIKQGMFGAKYEKYKEIYDKAEEYYMDSRMLGL